MGIAKFPYSRVIHGLIMIWDAHVVVHGLRHQYHAGDTHDTRQAGHTDSRTDFLVRTLEHFANRSSLSNASAPNLRARAVDRWIELLWAEANQIHYALRILHQPIVYKCVANQWMGASFPAMRMNT